MRRLLALALLSIAPVMSLPAHSETPSIAPGRTAASLEPVSARDCRQPTDAKEAQVLAFDKLSYEAKLAVALGKGEFKIVTIKIWDRSDDPRPLTPVIEAARITQGRLQFYTPNLGLDPEPVHDKQFVLVATLGGAQVCWATESSLLTDGAGASKSLTSPPAVAAAGRKRV